MGKFTIQPHGRLQEWIYKSMVDVRRFSPGERIVFLPYTEKTYAKTQAWMHERGLFEGQAPAVDYAACVAA